MVTTEQLIEKLTTKDVERILDEHNIEHKLNKTKDAIQCRSVCHGSNSFKLYYVIKDKKGEGKYFFCFSKCGGISIFQLLMDINNWTFNQSFKYVAKILDVKINHKKPKGFKKKNKKIKDWNFINKYKKINNQKEKKYNIEKYNKNILKVFDNIYPSSWEDEWIKPKAMKKFDICFHTSEFSTIIPHYNYYGKLIGIRSRHHLKYREENGNKYMPTFLENKMYNHSLNLNLYGCYQNKDAIKRKKKAILFESEKSVLQCESFYENENFSLALCGTNMSLFQRNILLYDLKVNEVIIALDKQYENIQIDEDETEEHKKYVLKVKKIANMLVNYVNVYIIYCTDDRLDYKDSPSDKGKEMLEQLMKEKIRYYKGD